MIKKWSEYITEAFKKVSHTEDDIYQYALDLIERQTESIFQWTHDEFDTESGDITPGQQFELSELQEKMAKIISEQVHQNLGKDFKKIRSSEIDVSELKELSDERDSINDGDEVIAVYFDGGYSIYKFKAVISDLGTGLGGETRQNEWYSIEDAYLVVKVSTYNDFVSPDKTI